MVPRRMVTTINKHIRHIADIAQSIPRRYYVFGGFIFMLVVLALVFWPRTIVFSYAGQTCFYQPVLAPELLRSQSDAFAIEPRDKLRVGDMTLASATMCVTPLRAPQKDTHTTQMSLLSVPLFTYHIKVSEPPAPSLHALADKPVPVSRALAIPLHERDEVFTYKLTVEGQNAVDCAAAGDKALKCDIPKLGLDQGVKYRLQLDRYFKGAKIATVGTKDIVTLTATSVTATSIKPNETVYAKPKSLEITMDKEIVSALVRLTKTEGDAKQEVPVSMDRAGKKLTVSWSDDLERQKTYELVTEKVVAADGSGLESAYKLQFTTSGGPKVKSINIGSYKVPVGATATLTFDQPILESQDPASVVAVTGGARVVGKKDAQVTVSFGGVPRCGGVRISVSDQLKSNYDISGGSAWKFDTRTICQTVGSIGASVKGRAISAYYFGSGQNTVIYTGMIHGNETSTRSLMMRWIDELESKPGSIPSDKRVVVIPVINPDGATAGSRTNANNVDLNRNFATSDWRSDITTTSNTPFPGGGGATAMSEPETKALAGFVAQQRPRLVLSYHSIGGLVATNQSGDSSSRASAYAKASGYRNTTGSSDAFEYGISGTADDYYAEKLGIPSVLVELGSHTYHQFELNREAMWSMLR